VALTKVTGQVINDSTGLVVGVTTVGGGLSATDGFFSGIVTAVGNASFSGNLTVGGVLTYEDVTNVDSVGLITARNGVVVGSGITLSKDGDIFATGITTISGNLKVGTGVTISPDGDGFFTGVVTATTFKGDGSQLSNVTSTTINNNADNRVITGSGSANTLEGESSLTYSSTGDLTQTVTVDGKGIVLSAGNLKPMITGDANRAAEGNTILGISGKWNGTEVARIAVEAGADTTNKDDATLNFSTTTSGGSLTKRMVIDSSGHALPGADNSYDLGSSSKRWRNVYTTDLKLSNEGSKNDVDGTWGNYTIQEGEDELFLINNRNGKKYKFNLTEVS